MKTYSIYNITMAVVFDSPDFMLNHIDINKLNPFSKIYIFIKGFIVGFVFKKFENSMFVFLLNILFFKKQRLFFNDGFYGLRYFDNLIYFPNKRVVRMFLDPDFHLKKLYETYCISKVDIQDNDIVIDCGSNIGELYYSFLIYNQKVIYYAFEPELRTYECLNMNLNTKKNVNLYNFALSNKSKKTTIYIDREGANSSLSNFGSSELKEVESKRLDDFKIDNVKLFKVEAEGHELEVLQGSTKILTRTKFVSIDYGPEKGAEQVSTMPEVIDFMYKNNFTLVSTSKYRQIGLFKNNNL